MLNTILTDMQRVAPSTDDYDIIFPMLKPEKIVHWRHFAVANLTTGGKTVKIGLVHGDYFIWIKSISLTTAGIWYTLENDFNLDSFWRPAARFVSPATGDQLAFNVIAEYVD